jgi:uncharacterized NAD-dependent epimerase/dehydratase family protein
VSEKKYLILAEEFSHDPHYGKTMRGVMRYRRESVVAILDTKRAGESDDGVPIVATVDEGMQYGPDTALVGVVTQGGRFPGDWQELLKSCVTHGLDLENGLHVRLHDIPGLPELAHEHGVELRDLREPPPDLSTATGANLEVDATIVLTVGSARSSSRPGRRGSRSPAGASPSTRSFPISSPARPSGWSSRAGSAAICFGSRDRGRSCTRSIPG